MKIRATDVRKSASFEQRLSVYSLSFLLAFQPLLASGQIVVDRNAGGGLQPGITEASNGVDIVNIVEASEAGVSHNQFEEFNVPEEGVILNNSAGIVETQLGGFINGNANLANGEARIILNEVTGNNRSSLLGFTEIAGRQAEYILANPYGITCNGCGFINTPRVTLTTGAPEMVNGQLRELEVTGGDVLIEGLGLNASSVEHFDILTRAAQVNAAIHAQDLRIITGANRFNYATGAASAIAGDGEAPQFGLDVAALGGMYANAIILTGTEHGVGVRAAGDMAASAGDLIMTANGDLVLNNASAAERVVLSSTRDLTVGGQLYGDAVHALAGDTITFDNAQVAARRQVGLRAPNLNNQGEIAVGYNAAGQAVEGGLLNMDVSDVLTNAGRMVATDRVNLAAGTYINDGESAFLAADNEIRLNATDMINRSSRVTSGGDIGIAVENLLDNSGGAISAGGALDLQVGGLFVNHNGGIGGAATDGLTIGELGNAGSQLAFDQQSLTLNLGSLDNRDGRIDHTGGGLFTLNIEQDFMNQSGALITNGSATIEAQNIFNQNGHLVAEQALTLNARDEINNLAGEMGARSLVASGSNISNRLGRMIAGEIELTGGSVDNSGGYIQSGELSVAIAQDLLNSAVNGEGGVILNSGTNTDDLSFSVTGNFDNSGGTAHFAADDSRLSVGNLTNASGTLVHAGAGTFSLEVEDDADNSGGRIETSAHLAVNGQTLDNTGGKIVARVGADVDLDQSLINLSGSVSAGANLNVTSNTVDNTRGAIDASVLMLRASTAFHNEAGTIASSESLDITTQNLTNEQGGIEAAGLNIAADAIDNTKGRIANLGDASAHIIASQLLDNTEGLIGSTTSLNFDVETVQNTLGEMVADQMSLDAREVMNHGGLIEANTVAISVSGDLTNTTEAGEQGTIAALANTFNSLLLDVGGHFDNSGGATRTNAVGLTLSAGALSNSHGSIAHSGDGTLNLNVGAAVDNSEGSLHAGGGLSLSAGSVRNSGGEIAIAGSAEITADAVDNRDGTLRINGEAPSVLTVAGSLQNQRGLISSQAERTSIAARDILNDRGEILQASAGSVELDAERLVNRQGRIAGNSTLGLRVGALDNTRGELFAGDVHLNAATAVNDGGLIEADAINLSIDGTLTNGSVGGHAGMISAVSEQADALTLNVGGGFDNGSGVVQTAAETASITAGSLNNEAGQVIHAGSGLFAVHAGTGLTNKFGGRLTSAGDLQVQSGGIDNREGVIRAQSGVELLSSGGIRNESGSIRAGNSLAVESRGIDNTSGVLANTGTGSTVVRADGEFDNTGGVFESAGSDVLLSAKSIDNSQGRMAHAGTGAFAISADDSLNNAGGELASAGAVSLAADVVDNTLASVHADTIEVHSEELDNNGGRLEANRVSLHVSKSLSNGRAQGQQGLISALSNTVDALLVSVGGGLLNRGTIRSDATTMSISARNLDNGEGSILHAGAGVLTLEFQSALNNNSGKIESSGGLAASAAVLQNLGGLIATKERLDLNVEEINNSSGLIDSAGTIDVASHKFNNREGSVIAAGTGASTIEVEGELDNTRGALRTNGDLVSLNVNTLTNANGRIEHAGNTLRVGAQVINNAEGTVATNSDLALTFDELSNTGGTILGTQVNLAGGSADNASGLIEADDISVNLSEDFFNTGDSGGGTVSAYGNASASLSIVVGGAYDNSKGLTQTQARDASITAQTVINSNGRLIHIGAGSLSIAANQAVENTAGRVESNGSVSVAGARFANDGGTLRGAGNIQVNVSGVANNSSGTLSAGRYLNLFAGLLDNNSGTITSSGDGQESFSHISIDQTLDNTTGILQSANETFEIAAGSVENRGGSIRHSGSESLTITADKNLQSISGEILSEGAIGITAQDLVNRSGLIEGREIGVIANSLANQSGTVEGNTVLLDIVGDLNNTQAGGDSESIISALSEASNALFLEVGGTFDNSRGLTQTKGVDAYISASDLINAKGGEIVHAGTGELLLTASSGITNQGAINSNGSLVLESGHLKNQGGTLSSASQMTLNLTGPLDNSGGTIDTAGALTLFSTGIFNTQGGSIISAGEGEARIESFGAHGTIDNSGGSIKTNSQNLIITGQKITNIGGDILQAASDSVEGDPNLTISARRFENTGTLWSQGEVKLEVGELANRSGLVQGRKVSVKSNSTDNTAGVIEADIIDLIIQGDFINSIAGGERGYVTATASTGRGLHAEVAGTYNNSGGVTQSSSREVFIEAERFVNKKGQLVKAGAGMLELRVAELDNKLGAIASAGDANLQGDSLWNNGGSILVENLLRVRASEQLDNTTGVLGTEGDLDLRAQSLTNSGGQVLAAGSGESSLNIAGHLENTGGTLSSNAGSYAISALSITNNTDSKGRGGKIHHAGDSLTLNADSIEVSGEVLAAGDLALAASDTAIEGGVVAAADAHITGNSLHNDGGVIEADKVTIDLDTSLKLSSETARITAYGTTDGALSIDVNDLISNEGTIESNGRSATIVASSINNSGGRIAHAGKRVIHFDASGGSLTNKSGEIDSDGGVNLSAASVDNSSGGSIFAADWLEVTADGLLNNSGGQIETLNGFNITAGSADNSAGIMKASGSTGVAKLDAGASLKNDGGTIHSNTAGLTIIADSLSNQGSPENTQGRIHHVGSDELFLGVTTKLDNTGEIGSTSAVSVGDENQNLVFTNIAKGTIFGASLNVWADSITNTAGAVLEGDAVELTAATSITNTDGAVIDAFVPEPEDATETGIPGSLSIATKSFDNSGGTTQTNDELINFDFETFFNVGGTLNQESVGGSMAIEVANALDNDGGTIQSSGSVRIDSASVINTGEANLLAGGDIALNVDGSISNDGRLDSGGVLSVDAASITNSATGEIYSIGDGDSDWTLKGKLQNDGGTIRSNSDNFSIAAKSFVNAAEGDLQHTGSGRLGIVITNGVTNSGAAKLASNGAVDMVASRVDNLGGSKVFGTAISVDSTTLKNAAGSVIEANELTLKVADLIENRGILGGYADGAAAVFKITDGSDDGQSNLVLSNQSGGALRTNAAHATIAVKQFNNSSGGVVIHDGTGVFNTTATESVTNKGGAIDSDGVLEIGANAFNNEEGEARASRGLEVDVGGELNNNSGVLDSGTSMTVNANALINMNGSLIAEGEEGETSIQTSTVDNTDGEILVRNETFDFNASRVTNSTVASEEGAAIHHSGSGRFRFDVDDSVTNSGGQIGSSSILMVGADGEEPSASSLIFDNALGEVFGNSVEVIAEGWNNSGGTIMGQAVDIRLINDLDNSADGENRGLVIAQSTLGNSLTMDLGGALINKGGVVQSGGGIAAVDVNSLTNEQGTIHMDGTGHLAVAVEERANNATGTISSADGLFLSAQQIDNNTSGRILASGSIGLVSEADLNNEQGLIEAAAGVTLTVNSGELINRSGEIRSFGEVPATLAATGGIDNSNGDIYIFGGGEAVSIETAGTLSNQDGILQHQGTGDFTLNAEQIDNLTVNGRTVTLVDGAESTKGALITSAGTLKATGFNLLRNTTEHSELKSGISADHLELTSERPGARISNTGGRIYASGDDSLVINLEQLDNDNDGMISSVGHATVDVDRLNNRNGLVQSTTSVTLELPTFDFSNGTFNAGETLTINTAGNLTNNAGNEFIAKNNLEISTNGSITNAGLISTGGTIDLFTGNSNFDNASTGEIKAGANLEIDAGTVSNEGVMSAVADMTIEGSAFDNAHQVITGGNFSATVTGDIDNRNLLFAKGSIGLYTPANITNHPGSDVYSLMGNVVIAGEALPGDYQLGDSVAKAASVVNSSARIEARAMGATEGGDDIGSGSGGDIWIFGDQIINKMSVLEIEKDIQYDYTEEKESWDDLITPIWEGRVIKTWYYHDKLLKDDAMAQIVAGDALVVEGGDIENVHSRMVAHNLIKLDGNDLANREEELVTEYESVQWWDTYSDQDSNDLTNVGIVNVEIIDRYPSQILSGGDILGNFAGRIENGSAAPVSDINHQADFQTRSLKRTESSHLAEATKDGIGGGEEAPTLTARVADSAAGETQAEGDQDRGVITKAGSIGDVASIREGSNMKLEEADSSNESNSISNSGYSPEATGEMLLGATLEEVMGRGSNTIRSSYDEAQVTDDGSTVISVSGDTSEAEIDQNRADAVQGARSSATQQTIVSEQPQVGVDADQAEELVVQRSSGPVDSGEATESKPPATASAPTISASQPTKVEEPTAEAPVPVEIEDRERPEAPVTEDPVQVVEVYNPTTRLNLPQNDGLFVVNREPEASYLVETNPAIATMVDFISSDYLLNQLGYDPSELTKRLGDGFYEMELVREAIWNTRGQRYLADVQGNSLGDDQRQFRYLMDNAVASSEALNLTPGIALTAEQTARLTHDIVWLEEQQVNGQSVLVPVYYATTANGTDFHKGAVISGTNVRLHADKGFDNSGIISGRGSVELSTDMEFANTGLVTGDGGVRIDAASITNERLDNSRGGVIESLQGVVDFLASTGDITNVNGSIRGQSVQMQALEGSIASSGRIEARKDVIAIAKRDILNGIGETSGHISAGNNLSLKAEEGSIRSRIGSRSRKSLNVELTSLNEAATLSAGNNVILNAGTDIELTGTRMNAGGDIDATAGNDIQIKSGVRRVSVHDDGGRHKNITERTEHTSSELNAGGNISFDAGRDVQLIGSTANAEGSITATAGRDLTMEAAANRDHRQLGTERNGTIRTSVTHVQSAFNAGGDVSVTSERDSSLIGSSIAAGGDVAMHAKRDTTIAAVNDSEYNYEISTKDRSFGRKKVTVSEEYQETAVGGAISAGGYVLINARKAGDLLITQESENVNIVGGSIDAANDAIISADESVDVTGSRYTESSYQNTQKTGFAGLSGKEKGNVEATTHLNQASITSGGDATVIAGDDIKLAGIQVVAEGDVNLEAVDELLISAGEVSKQSDTWSKSSGLFTGGSLYSSSESREGESVTTAEASTIVAGGTVKGRAGETRIVGSDVHGDEAVDLQSDIGETQITTASTTRETFEYEKEVNVGLGGLADGLSNPGELIETDDGRLKVNLASASYDESEAKTSLDGVLSSNITSGGDVKIGAETDVLIEGSNVAADLDEDGTGDVSLHAGRDVKITEATEQFTSETQTTSGEAELSVVVQHQAVEVAKAAEALDDATEKLGQAKRDYKQYDKELSNLKNQLTALEADYQNQEPGVSYQNIQDLRGLVADVESDKEWYVAGVGLAAADVTAKTTALAQQTAAAAQSTGTYGFNAGLQLDVQATQTDEHLTESTSVASTVSGQNISIQTGLSQETALEDSNTTIRGSHLVAAGELSVNTGELNVEASQDTLETSTESENVQTTAQMTVYGGSGGASVNGSYNRSRSTMSQTTHNNSTLTGDSVVITTTGDTNIRGGNVHGESSLTANIGGDLNLESQQDRSRSRNNSAGVSAGLSFGGNGGGEGIQGAGDVGGASGVNGGLNASNGRSESKETVLSSLTSGGTADITVGGTTRITGATLATVDEEGNDLGNLNLDTDKLEHTDLRYSHTNSQQSAGLSTNMTLSGTTGAEAEQGLDNTELEANFSNLAYSNTSHTDATNVMATLGSGNITVGGEQLEKDGKLTDAGAADDSALSGLNRDTTDTTRELWDVDQQEGNIDVTVDHRMLSEDGREEIKENFVDSKEFGEDIAYSTRTVGENEQLGITDYWTTLDNTAKGTQIKNELARNPEYAHIVEGLKSGEGDQYAKAMEDLGHLAQDKFGVELSEINLYDATATDSLSLENNLIYDTQGGIVTEQNHEQYGDIFVNAQEGKTKTDMANTLGHEVLESRTLQEGAANDDAQEAQAIVFGTHFSRRVDQAAGGDLDSTGGADFSHNLANSQSVADGTLRADGVGSAAVDHRQLYRPEMEAISTAAERMAAEEGISQQRAEQRLAVELLDNLDASWNEKNAAEGRDTDAVALDYLSEALAEQGGFYAPDQPTSDIPLLPGEAEPEPEYTAGEVKNWLQEYSTNHTREFEDRTRGAEDLNNSFSEMTAFYDRNLKAEQTFADTFDKQRGEIAGAASVVGDMVEGLQAFARNPGDVGEAMVHDTMTMFKDPFEYAGDVVEAKQESELNSILDTYQGDFYGAGYNETRGDVNLALEAAGVIPAGKPAKLNKLATGSAGDITREIESLQNIGRSQRENLKLPADGGLPPEGAPITNRTARTLLEKRGATSAQSLQVVESFEGGITATQGRAGETFVVTESAPGEASAAFVTRESAGATSVERQQNLALPLTNSATVEGSAILNRDQVLLEGEVASQASTPGFPPTALGGGSQVFTDSHNGGVTRRLRPSPSVGTRTQSSHEGLRSPPSLSTTSQDVDDAATTVTGGVREHGSVAPDRQSPDNATLIQEALDTEARERYEHVHDPKNAKVGDNRQRDREFYNDLKRSEEHRRPVEERNNKKAKLLEGVREMIDLLTGD